jgi:hypothetical protein
MHRVDATAYLAPYAPRRVRRPVAIRLTDDTYPLEPSPEQAWLPIAFRAFAALAAESRVEDLLILGTGNGLDVLGAAEIFPDLRCVVATDLHPACVEVARENVRANLADERAGVACEFHAGHLLEPVARQRRFNLVYENLPNLPAPAPAKRELRRGTIGGRFYDASGLDVPEPFGAYLLALHHRCLRDARMRVRPGGGVLTALGGRVPLEVAFDLHRTCGYVPRLVAFDVKLQVEAELVVPAYREAEARDGVQLTFYAAEAIALVASARAAGLEGGALAAAVAPDLDRLAMSATQAEMRVGRGEPVAHSVLMICGRRP